MKSGNPDARISDYFDVSAGAGVGGIFTAMLFATKDQSRPIFQADDTWQFLTEQAKTFNRSGTRSRFGIFRPFWKARGASLTASATAALEQALKKAFSQNGRSLTLKGTLKPILIPCYDLSSTAPLLFSRADALESENYDFQLWEVRRATSTEPALFEPVSMESIDKQTNCLGIDGDLTMSNPTAAAITHVLHNKQEFPFVRGVEDLLVLSLGTGQGFEGSYAYDYKQVRKWKGREWTQPMARISGDCSAEMLDQAVAMAFGQSRNSNYVRIQANSSSLDQGSGTVNAGPSARNTNMLVQLAKEMLKQKNVESVLFGGRRISEQSNLVKLDWFAGELVLEHQRRSCRIAPTVAFKQATPKTS